MLRVLAEVGTQAEWFLVFIAAAVGVLVLVCVVAAFEAMFTSDPERRQICYRIFCALLRFFRRRRGR
jgi:hypothetical protein